MMTSEEESGIRRSSRANKGIPKEIFDPSDLPKTSYIRRQDSSSRLSFGRGRSSSQEDESPKPSRRPSSDTLRRSSSSSSGSKNVALLKEENTLASNKSTPISEKRPRGWSLAKRKPDPARNKPTAMKNADDSFDDEDDVPLRLRNNFDDDDEVPLRRLKEERSKRAPPAPVKSKKSQSSSAVPSSALRTPPAAGSPPLQSSPAAGSARVVSTPAPPAASVSTDPVSSLSSALFSSSSEDGGDGDAHDADYKMDDRQDDDDDDGGDDDSYSSDDSYNNPDRLWCICRQPHNNKFMISCDQCEDWFHGECVGITLQRGKKMEEKGEEYVCPKCVKTMTKQELGIEPGRQIVDVVSSGDQTKAANTTGGGMNLKGYALKGHIKTKHSGSDSDQPAKKKSKIFPETKVKHERTEQGNRQKKHVKSEPKRDGQQQGTAKRKCIVTSCENDAQPESIYCSNQCILRHAKDSLKTMVKEKSNPGSKPKIEEANQNRSSGGGQQQKHRSGKDRITVRCKKTGRVLTGSHAPMRRDLSAFLRSHPSYEVHKRHKPQESASVSPAGKQHPGSGENSKSGSPSASRLASVDFFKHVESQHRKRDRYGLVTDPSYAPTPARKVVDLVAGGKPKPHHASDIDKKKARMMSGAPTDHVKRPPDGASPPKSGKERMSKEEHRISKEERRKMQHAADHHKHKMHAEHKRLQEKRRAAEHERRKSAQNSLSSSTKQSGHPGKSESKGEKSKIHRSEPKPPHQSAEEKERKSKDSVKLNEVRLSVRKSLLDILKSRSEASDDLKMHPSSISHLVNKVEDSLFKLFGETGTKYKNKYRSIMFNLKDSRNQGLWRKVIIGEVTTGELVQMTAEQMASKKLAEWRQNELTTELDIIQKQEKERANFRPVAKITHKGEIAIQEDLSDLTPSVKRDVSVPDVAPARKKRNSTTDEKGVSDEAATQNDTTMQHRDHLFDLNCKICTGKVKEEELNFEKDAAAVEKRAVKSSSSIILSTEMTSSSKERDPKEAPTSQIAIAPKIRRTKEEKLEARRSDSKSHDATLSPATILTSISKSVASEKLMADQKKRIQLPAPPPIHELATRPDDDPDDSHDEEEEEDDYVEDAEFVDPATAEVEDVAEMQEDKEETTAVTPTSDESKSADGESDDTLAPVPEVEEEIEPSPPDSASKPVVSGLIWSGYISMLELSTFKANVYPVCGSCHNLDIDLPIRMTLGGRIHPKVVWDYLGQVRSLASKQLSIVRFHASTSDDRVGYVAMLSYFSSRNRFGVLSNQDRLLVKDMYLVPLLESQPIPAQLTACTDDDLNEALPPTRPSMLIGIVVRQISKQLRDAEKSRPVASAAMAANTDQKVSKSVDDPSAEKAADVDGGGTTSPALPMTEEQAASSNPPPTAAASTSIFERNKSLTPSLRFFMRKASEEQRWQREEGEISREEQEAKQDDDDDDDEAEEGYSPGGHDKGVSVDTAYRPSSKTSDIPDDENDDDDDSNDAYDPEQEEEYDPETAFAPVSPKDDDLPYDPEQDEERLLKMESSKEMDELVEKQAFLEKMKRELEAERAKLAEVEQSLQKQTASAAASSSPAALDSPVKPTRIDPRLARRKEPSALQEEKQPELKPVDDEKELPKQNASQDQKQETNQCVLQPQQPVQPLPQKKPSERFFEKQLAKKCPEKLIPLKVQDNSEQKPQVKTSAQDVDEQPEAVTKSSVNGSPTELDNAMSDGPPRAANSQPVTTVSSLSSQTATLDNIIAQAANSEKPNRDEKPVANPLQTILSALNMRTAPSTNLLSSLFQPKPPEKTPSPSSITPPSSSVLQTPNTVSKSSVDQVSSSPLSTPTDSIITTSSVPLQSPSSHSTSVNPLSSIPLPDVPPSIPLPDTPASSSTETAASTPVSTPVISTNSIPVAAPAPTPTPVPAPVPASTFLIAPFSIRPKSTKPLPLAKLAQLPPGVPPAIGYSSSAIVSPSSPPLTSAPVAPSSTTHPVPSSVTLHLPSAPPSSNQLSPISNETPTSPPSVANSGIDSITNTLPASIPLNSIPLPSSNPLSSVTPSPISSPSVSQHSHISASPTPQLNPIVSYPSSPPQLPDSTTKSDVEDEKESSTLDNSGVATPPTGDPTSPNVQTPLPMGEIQMEEPTKHNSSHRARSGSSTTSRDSSRKKHRERDDDGVRRHHKHKSRERRSRSRSPHRRHHHHHHKRHDDHRHGRDRRR